MAHFYIDGSIGTATGDAGRFASAQTGAFTAGTSYATEAAAFAATTPPAAGDTMYFSDNHSFDSGAVSISNVIANLTNPIRQVCADNANRDAHRTTEAGRAKEFTSSGTTADVTLTGSRVVYGMEYSTVDDLIVRCDGGAQSFNDCKFAVVNGGLVQIQGQLINTINNSELALNNTGASIFIGTSAGLAFNGGSVTTTTGGVTNLTIVGFNSGGGLLNFRCADVSAITGNLVGNAGGTVTTDDTIDVAFDLCKLASGVSRANETMKSVDQRVLTTRCSSISAAAEYQYGLTALGGDVDDDSVIFREDDPAFADSGTKISYKIITNSDASIDAPLWFDIPNNRFAALSAGATDTLRFYVASTTTLTNADIWIEISYPDGTNKQTPNHASSATTASWTSTINPLATGTTLTTDSGSDWRDGVGALAGHNEYQIDVLTSGDVGADCVPMVRIFIAKPSVTIQIASIYELN